MPHIRCKHDRSVHGPPGPPHVPARRSWGPAGASVEVHNVPHSDQALGAHPTINRGGAMAPRASYYDLFNWELYWILMVFLAGLVAPDSSATRCGGCVRPRP